ncbi:MAG: hypothetical protein WC658_03485, partial [Candidatus Omnitrophota bacterium]
SILKEKESRLREILFVHFAGNLEKQREIAAAIIEVYANFRVMQDSVRAGLWLIMEPLAEVMEPSIGERQELRYSVAYQMMRMLITELWFPEIAGDRRLECRDWRVRLGEAGQINSFVQDTARQLLHREFVFRDEELKGSSSAEGSNSRFHVLEPQELPELGGIGCDSELAKFRVTYDLDRVRLMDETAPRIAAHSQALSLMRVNEHRVRESLCRIRQHEMERSSGGLRFDISGRVTVEFTYDTGGRLGRVIADEDGETIVQLHWRILRAPRLVALVTIIEEILHYLRPGEDERVHKAIDSYVVFTPSIATGEFILQCRLAELRGIVFSDNNSEAGRIPLLANILQHAEGILPSITPRRPAYSPANLVPKPTVALIQGVLTQRNVIAAEGDVTIDYLGSGSVLDAVIFSGNTATLRQLGRAPLSINDFATAVGCEADDLPAGLAWRQAVAARNLQEAKMIPGILRAEIAKQDTQFYRATVSSSGDVFYVCLYKNEEAFRKAGVLLWNNREGHSAISQEVFDLGDYAGALFIPSLPRAEIVQQSLFSDDPAATWDGHEVSEATIHMIDGMLEQLEKRGVLDDIAGHGDYLIDGDYINYAENALRRLQAGEESLFDYRLSRKLAGVNFVWAPEEISPHFVQEGIIAYNWVDSKGQQWVFVYSEIDLETDTLNLIVFLGVLSHEMCAVYGLPHEVNNIIAHIVESQHDYNPETNKIFFRHPEDESQEVREAHARQLGIIKTGLGIQNELGRTLYYSTMLCFPFPAGRDRAGIFPHKEASRALCERSPSVLFMREFGREAGKVLQFLGLTPQELEGLASYDCSLVTDVIDNDFGTTPAGQLLHYLNWHDQAVQQPVYHHLLTFNKPGPQPPIGFYVKSYASGCRNLRDKEFRLAEAAARQGITPKIQRLSYQRRPSLMQLSVTGESVFNITGHNIQLQFASELGRKLGLLHRLGIIHEELLNRREQIVAAGQTSAVPFLHSKHVVFSAVGGTVRVWFIDFDYAHRPSRKEELAGQRKNVENALLNSLFQPNKWWYRYNKIQSRLEQLKVSFNQGYQIGAQLSSNYPRAGAGRLQLQYCQSEIGFPRQIIVNFYDRVNAVNSAAGELDSISLAGFDTLSGLSYLAMALSCGRWAFDERYYERNCGITFAWAGEMNVLAAAVTTFNGEAKITGQQVLLNIHLKEVLDAIGGLSVQELDAAAETVLGQFAELRANPWHRERFEKLKIDLQEAARNPAVLSLAAELFLQHALAHELAECRLHLLRRLFGFPGKAIQELNTEVAASAVARDFLATFITDYDRVHPEETPALEAALLIVEALVNRKDSNGQAGVYSRHMQFFQEAKLTREREVRLQDIVRFHQRSLGYHERPDYHSIARCLAFCGTDEVTQDRLGLNEWFMVSPPEMSRRTSRLAQRVSATTGPFAPGQIISCYPPEDSGNDEAESFPTDRPPFIYRVTDTIYVVPEPLLLVNMLRWLKGIRIPAAAQTTPAVVDGIYGNAVRAVIQEFVSSGDLSIEAGEALIGLYTTPNLTIVSTSAMEAGLAT